MMKITELNAQGKTKGGEAVIQYMLAVEYYRDKDGLAVSASEWWGGGAEALGLKGKVKEEQMKSLTRGFAPGADGKDGRALCRNAGQPPREEVIKDKHGNPRLDKDGNELKRLRGGHRVGADCTFHTTKAVDVAYADATPEMRDKIMNAHITATKAALGYLEEHAETRRGRGGKRVIGAKMVVSMHHHVGSRSLDPKIHTHALRYSVVQGEDGQWGKISAEEHYKQQKTVGAFYRATLAYEMRKLGFGIEKRYELDKDGLRTGNVYFGIAGIDKSVEDIFSKRREAIVEYLKQNPGVSSQAATLATRQEKEEPPFEELVAIWGETFASLRREDPKLFASTEAVVGLKDNFGEAVTDEETLERLHEKNAVWTRGELLERIALESMGRLSPEAMIQEVDNFLVRNKLVQVAAPELHPDDASYQLAIRHREVNFASQEILDREKRIVENAKERREDQVVRLDPVRVAESVASYEQLKGVTLDPEQRKVVEWATTGTGGVCVITGVAGAGKTFTSGAWVKAFEDQGHEVIGTAVSWKAAKKLESESGITSYSTRSLLSQLKSGKVVLHPRSVVVLDEAGMAGSHTVDQLQQHCDTAGAKLVLQGDALQLQPIESGAPFRLAVEAVGEARLTGIRRQKRQVDRDTASTFYEEGQEIRSRAQNRALGEKILERLEANGQLAPYRTQSDAVDNLVSEHMASTKPDREKLVLGCTNEDVALLNRKIRDSMRTAGRLKSEDVLIKGTEAGKDIDLPVAVGDRIRFGKGERDIGVDNGDVGVVERVTQSKGRTKIAVRLESDISMKDNNLVEFEADRYTDVSYGFASTNHKAQGLGMLEVRQLANLGMFDRQSVLVSFTRMKENYRLYGNDDALDPEVLAERIGTDRLKVNALERLALKRKQDAARARKPRAPTVARGEQPTAQSRDDRRRPGQTRQRLADAVAEKRMKELLGQVKKERQPLRGRKPAQDEDRNLARNFSKLIRELGQTAERLIARIKSRPAHKREHKRQQGQGLGM
ncbi:MAG: relaxase domain-containing protein [Rudaea sp.]|uniref:MobF family relaxase n=1 Tax=unclassified Rudaea TaxID=2627037 RepID=UPI0010F72EBC|nr:MULTISPECIES: MobF family relaxase [unclassified Rudaea]MBN8884476.1 relaxase domain-containing protein [Rudaea sp.]